MGTLTPHVHGGWDSGTCLVLGYGGGDSDLGSSLGSVNNLLCDLEPRRSFPPRVSVSSNYKMIRGSLLDS